MKEDNKLKKFVKDHELAFAITGGTVIFIAGACIGGKVYMRSRMGRMQHARNLEALASMNKHVKGLLEVCKLCDAGTRCTSFYAPSNTITVAEWFGDNLDAFIEGSNIQPDDIVTNVIYNIAKKAET